MNTLKYKSPIYPLAMIDEVLVMLDVIVLIISPSTLVTVLFALKFINDLLTASHKYYLAAKDGERGAK